MGAAVGHPVPLVHSTHPRLELHTSPFGHMPPVPQAIAGVDVDALEPPPHAAALAATSAQKTTRVHPARRLVAEVVERTRNRSKEGVCINLGSAASRAESGPTGRRPRRFQCARASTDQLVRSPSVRSAPLRALRAARARGSRRG
jgi:hypothetical protein